MKPKISKPICQIAYFRKKLKADWMRGMLTISQVWVLCLPVRSITTRKLWYDYNFSRTFVQGCLLGNAGAGANPDMREPLKCIRWKQWNLVATICGCLWGQLWLCMAVKFDPLTLDHEIKSLRRIFVPKWKEERESVEVARGEA